MTGSRLIGTPRTHERRSAIAGRTKMLLSPRPCRNGDACFRLSISNRASNRFPSGPHRLGCFTANLQLQRSPRQLRISATRSTRFRYRSCCSCLLALRRRCAKHLRGMLPSRSGMTQAELFLARDRVGKKPLLYAQTANGGLVFASEFMPLLLHPEVIATSITKALLLPHVHVRAGAPHRVSPNQKT